MDPPIEDIVAKLASLAIFNIINTVEEKCERAFIYVFFSEDL